jgi:hypothetical protein
MHCGRGTAEDKAQWKEFLHITASMEQDANSASTTSSGTHESHAKENAPLSASPSAEKDAPPDSQLHSFNDPGDVDPRFQLTDDIHEAMDALIEQGEEEVMPERLLNGYFKHLFEGGNLNTIDDVKAAYARVLGTDECVVSANFVYELTLNMFRSSDPFGLIARDFAGKQMDMLEGERKLYRENMKQLQ